MFGGRRGLFLCACFVIIWLGLFTDHHPLAAQPPQRGWGRDREFFPTDPATGRHKIWRETVNPDEVREFLAQMGSHPSATDDAFMNLLKRMVKEKNPNATDAEIEAAAQRLLSDKAFRDRLTDLIQKYKNQPLPPGPGGRVPQQPSAEEVAKLLQSLRSNGQVPGDPFKLPPSPKLPPTSAPPSEPKNPPFDPGQLPGGTPKTPPPFSPLPIDPKTGQPFNPRTGEVLEPHELRPFNPKNPHFDPRRFPAIDPKNPPEFDKKTGFPIDPKTGKLFDPRTGQEIDPDNPPPIEPVPAPPPSIEPKIPTEPKIPSEPLPTKPQPKPQPAVPPPGVDEPPANDIRRFDPDQPLGPVEESPEKIAKTRALEAATALWERNVGPIDESPAVKRALQELVNDNDVMNSLFDEKGNSFFDSLKGDSDKDWADWFRFDDGWEWPDFNFGWRWGTIDWGLGSGRGRDHTLNLDGASASSRSSSAWDSLGTVHIGTLKVPMLLVLIIVAVIIAIVLWRKWDALRPWRRHDGRAVAESGWPLDPRTINSREDVVKAFEYLSVLLCGHDAKTWTHSTIADALVSLARTHVETAIKLARLYELARYTPLDEPLTRVEVLEARRLVCELAGVDEV
ncbi:MAG: hypothetical protein RMJ56_00605 [Gemmataceae bacterium]|nr:hypothetical protein [Gemmata sp.]MDW8196080.1 hypothetical protein [Gemmataceae bacterium]